MFLAWLQEEAYLWMCSPSVSCWVQGGGVLLILLLVPLLYLNHIGLGDDGYWHWACWSIGECQDKPHVKHGRSHHSVWLREDAHLSDHRWHALAVFRSQHMPDPLHTSTPQVRNNLQTLTIYNQQCGRCNNWLLSIAMLGNSHLTLWRRPAHTLTTQNPKICSHINHYRCHFIILWDTSPHKTL